MVCTAKVSKGLLRFKKFLRALWKSANLLTTDTIGDVDREALFKTGNVKGDAFSVISARFAAVIGVYITHGMILTNLNFAPGISTKTRARISPAPGREQKMDPSQ